MGARKSSTSRRPFESSVERVLHLGAELNYHRMFEEALGNFQLERLAADQAAALAKAGLA